MTVKMRADITAIPWHLYRHRQLLNTPHLFAPGITGLTEETLPLLLQETNKVFLPVPGQRRPRLETKEEQIAVGTEKVRCPMCEGRLTVGQLHSQVAGPRGGRCKGDRPLRRYLQLSFRPGTQ